MIPSPTQEFLQALIKAMPLMTVCFLLMWHGRIVHRITHVVVTQQFDPYYYEFLQLETGEKYNRHICKDYESPAKDFVPGKVFDAIGFIDTPDCWSLNPDSQAYYKEAYDHNGKPVYWQEKEGQEQRQSSAAP